MPSRRNEEQSMVRQEPLAYKAEYNASNQVEYEAWASPGTALTDSAWIACKHTYDASGNITRTEWNQETETIHGVVMTRVGNFLSTATDLSTLTYV